MNRKILFSSNAGILATVFLLFSMVGCGGDEISKPTATVEGKVLLNDQPVEGTVVFQSPDTGGIFSSELDASGQFNIEQVEVGSYTVYVTPPQLTTPPEGPEDAKKSEELKSDIPAGYENIETSDLRANVEEGKTNSFTFELKPGGPPK